MTNPLIPFQKAVATNSAAACSVTGCSHRRDKMSRYCKAHVTTYRRSGHPEGSVVYTQELVQPRNDVRKFLARHNGHPGVVAAVQWLDRSIANSFIPAGLYAYSPPEMLALEMWHRLKLRGVTGAEVFETLVAMMLLNHRKPDRFHHQEELVTQLGTKLVRHRFGTGIAAKEQHRHTGRAARRYIGEVVLLNIGVLIQRLVEHLEREKLSPPIAQLPGLDVPFDVTQYGADPLH